MPPESTIAPRVAMLAPGELFGGAERQVLLLMRFLQAHGVYCALLVFYDREIARQARLLRIPTHILQGRSGLDPKIVRELVRYLRDNSLNVVHLHGYKPAAAALAARCSHRFAAVKTEHGGSELQDAPVLVQLKLRAYRMIENWSVRWLEASVVYVTADLQRQSMQEHRGLVTQVISNGIDSMTLEALPRPPELDPDRFNLVVAGRLDPVKGIDVAIRALKDDRMPHRALLHIVGDGPLREHLQQLARDSGVAQKVRFHGFRTDATTFIANADGVLMPSLHEGCPYTLLESLAAGVPVVASCVGGLKENLRDRQTALLFKSGDVAGLAEAVDALHGEPGLARTLSTRASQELLPRFSVAAMGEAYLKLYRQLAGHLCGGRPDRAI